MNNQSNEKRRKALLAILAGGAGAAVLQASNWQAPVTKSLILPAHAATSSVATCWTSYSITGEPIETLLYADRDIRFFLQTNLPNTPVILTIDPNTPFPLPLIISTSTDANGLAREGIIFGPPTSTATWTLPSGMVLCSHPFQISPAPQF